MKALRRLLNRWGRANVFGHVSTSESLLWYGSLQVHRCVYHGMCVLFPTEVEIFQILLHCTWRQIMHQNSSRRSTLAARISTQTVLLYALGWTWGGSEFDIPTVKKSVCLELYRCPEVMSSLWRGKQSDILFEQDKIIHSILFRPILFIDKHT